MQQEGAQVRRMMGSGRWKGKIEEMHWKTWCITVRRQQREPWYIPVGKDTYIELTERLVDTSF